MRNTITTATIILSISAFACGNRTGSEEAKSQQAIERCDAAAMKVARLRGGDENAKADHYKEIITACTPSGTTELTEIGESFLSCLEAANTGAAVHRCELDLVEANKSKTLEDLMERFDVEYRRIACGILDEDEQEKVFEELNELESSAVDAGHAKEKIAKMVADSIAKIEKAGCK